MSFTENSDGSTGYSIYVGVGPDFFEPRGLPVYVGTGETVDVVREVKDAYEILTSPGNAVVNGNWGGGSMGDMFKAINGAR
jgi:hypothetical protein